MAKEGLKVGIIMGSDSDLSVMRHAGRALDRLGLEELTDYEMRIISAHRTPEAMAKYAQEAEERELEVIIAGAGGSAHLPGMVASETIVPVLGVAVTKNPDVMNRALGSMIGMPEGKPLAVFQAEAGAFNAGLFAGRLLARHHPEVRQAYVDYETVLGREVLVKDSKLADKGSEVYLREKRMEAELRDSG
ncbi:MAG TPA: 5-(carboxyamino)imidazole ribonucleotide mutase [Candidatus Saccharimonadales bacterium]|nr:5-(carboxyamino)imidazole ribonucleotide mutase [Candidatus Saccharimonadales bacterium]